MDVVSFSMMGEGAGRLRDRPWFSNRWLPSFFFALLNHPRGNS